MIPPQPVQRFEASVGRKLRPDRKSTPRRKVVIECHGFDPRNEDTEPTLVVLAEAMDYLLPLGLKMGNVRRVEEKA